MSASSVHNDVNIMVCCHKKDFCFKGEGFYPIHVGKVLHPELDLGIQGDDTGENISTKNPNYCELTAHYWMWKNGPKSKYVGLNHYRRYFDFYSKLPGWIPYRVVPELRIKNSDLMLPDLNEIFADCQIILPRSIVYPHSLANNYRLAHIYEDFDIMENVIKEFWPDYLESFKYIMNRTNRLVHYNMFIAERKIFEDYSEWLFSVLSKIEEKVKISPYPSQARVFGYMAERLLNVYVHKHSLKVKYLPIIKISDETPLTSGQWLRSKLKNNIAWYVTKGYINQK